MYRNRKLFALIAVVALVALLVSGCGGEKPSASEEGKEILNLAHWDMSATTWSSPNGATVHITAEPAGYAEGQSAVFVVRLEGEDVKMEPCEWDGKNYTASVDLNGADGYCYYIALTGSDGTEAEIAVNVPTDPIDESLINMASALESHCSLIITTYHFDGKWLSITDGNLQVQPPRIVNEGETITCDKVELVISYNGVEDSRVVVEMSAPKEDGSYELSLTDLAFEVPEMEDDQQLSVAVNVSLSNGQSLAAAGGTWLYNNGELLMGVG